MTIHQLAKPCWELQPPTDPERMPHYGTEAEALTALAEDRENDERPYAGTKPVLIAAPCWLAQCDGGCEMVLDTEGEGYTVHCASRADAEGLAASYEWAYSADGRSVFCTECAAEGAEPVPPSPADLEAAGQMRLPGVA